MSDAAWWMQRINALRLIPDRDKAVREGNALMAKLTKTGMQQCPEAIPMLRRMLEELKPKRGRR